MTDSRDALIAGYLDAGPPMPRVSPFYELELLPRWLPFKLEWNPKREKHDKIPTIDGTRGISTKAPACWRTRDDADALKVFHRLPGVTLNLTGGVTDLTGEWLLLGLDFDSVEFTCITSAAIELLERLATYVEYSPSLTGFRAFAWVRKRDLAGLADNPSAQLGGCHQCELYIGSAPRHLTVTGRCLNTEPIRRLDPEQTALLVKHLKKATPPAPAAPPITPGMPFTPTARTENQRRMLAGERLQGQGNETVFGLLRDWLKHHPKEDTLATVLQSKLWPVYYLSKRNNETKALELARQDIENADEANRREKNQMDNLYKLHAGVNDPAATEPPQALLIERPLTKAILTTPVPPWVSVIGRFLPEKVVTEFNGAHGIGKSTNALHMCCCGATGEDYMGLATEGPCMTVFCTKEDPYDVIVQRIQEWLLGFDAEDRLRLHALLQKNLRIYGCDETEALMLTTTEDGRCVSREDAINECTERWQGARLVVLETASLLHAGDEMNEAMLVLVSTLKRIAGRLKAAVVLVRHISKQAAREGIEDSLVGRGASSFSDSARSVILLRELSPTEAKDEGIDLYALGGGEECALLRLVNTKNNYLLKEAPFYILRMGMRYRLIEPRGKEKVCEERVLNFMREQAAQGITEWSKTSLKSAGHAQTGLTQAQIEPTMARLVKAGTVIQKNSTAGGGCIKWMLAK